jgi:hypothetical protein
MPKRTDPNVVYLRSITELALQKNIIQLATSKGWTVVHVNDSRQQRATGLPDLLMIRQPRIVWAELKREPGAGGHKNDPTPPQVWWLNELKASGQEVYLWRPSHWMSGEINPVLE